MEKFACPLSPSKKVSRSGAVVPGGYLCTFQVYEGKPIEYVSGKPMSEKGMVSRVVKDLVGPFEGFNHVVYMDNFFTSGPLVQDLAENKIYVAGTIRQTSKGFPEI